MREILYNRQWEDLYMQELEDNLKIINESIENIKNLGDSL